MTDATSKRAATELDVSLVDQLNWAAAALGLGQVDCGDEGISIAPPAESFASGASGDGDGAGAAPPARADAQAVAALATHLPRESGAVADWLRQARRAAEHYSPSGVWEGEPVGDPQTIRDIAAALLSPFTIRHGHSRLAGCTLERRPTLRIGRLVEGVDAAGNPAPRVRWCYYAADGSRWDRETIGRRGWDRVRTTPNRLRGSERNSIEAWIEAVAEEQRDAAGEIVDLTVLWCRWAAGKIILQFDSGPSASVAFAGWASDYTRGGLQPPPFRCERSGRESYQVIALDDGTVTVPEAVARCQLTDRELLLDSLATCEVSGLRVDRERLAVCQATGLRALPDRLVECQWCGRRMIPRQIQRGRCEQCRHSGPIAADDPRLRALRDRHPRALEEMGSGRGWSGWIGADTGVIVGGGVLKNRLLVFDPHHGTIARRGTRAGISRRWRIEPAEERAAATPST